MNIIKIIKILPAAGYRLLVTGGFMRRLLIPALLSLFLTTTLFAASLKVILVDENNAPKANVKVVLVAFVAGEDEPNKDYTRVDYSDLQGEVLFDNLTIEESGIPIYYKAAFDEHKVYPTLKEQMHGSGGPMHLFNSTTENKEEGPIVLFPAPATDYRGKLVVQISTNSVAQGTLMMADVFHAITGEPVGFGMDVSTYNEATDEYYEFEIVNLHTAPENSFMLYVGKMGTDEGTEVLISTTIYNDQTSYLQVEMGYVSSQAGGNETTIDTSNIAFEGYVKNEVSGDPISNCDVEIRDMEWSRNYWLRTITDASGRFVFQKPINISSYCVTISKLGYNFKYDDNNSEGYIYQGDRFLLPPFELSEATGMVKGYVKLNGNNLPDAEVQIHSWMGEGRFDEGPYLSSDGGSGNYHTRTGADGYYEFRGVGSGNYNLEVRHNLIMKNTFYWHGNGAPDTNDFGGWSYNYSYGEDQKASTTWVTGGGYWKRIDDDMRVVVTTDTIETYVYTSSGTVYHGPNENIDINLTVQIFSNAKITGTLLFPADVNITDDILSSISIVAHPIDENYQWIEWSGEGTVYFGDSQQLVDNYNSSTKSTTYEVDVSTGMYYIEIKATNWAPLTKYNFDVELKEANDTWTLPDIKMVKAGKLVGKIKLPDGSYFQAREIKDNSGNPIGNFEAELKIRGVDVEFEEHNHLGAWSTDPTRFTFEALPPGKYNLWVEIKYNSFNSGKNDNSLYPPIMIPKVRIIAEETTYVEVGIEDGIMCEPLAPIPPDSPEVDYSVRSQNGIGFYQILVAPAEVTFTGEIVSQLFFSEGQAEDFMLHWLMFNPYLKVWQTRKIPEGKYNCYLSYIRMFGNERAINLQNHDGPPNNNPDQYITVISRAENVNIKSDDLMPGATFQIKMGAGVMGPGVITGRMKGQNFLLPEDGSKIKGKFQEFMKYIPTVMLYDFDGNWRGFSNALPPNDDATMFAWDTAIMTGDAVTINTLINSDDPNIASPCSYYIDNLPTGKYVMVCETRNYPPVTKIVTITTGTVTIDVDFDTDAAPGAAISGTVVDESGNPLPDANVILKHRLATKKVITDDQGQFNMNGLQMGTYRIDATKSGYAIGGEKVSLGRDNETVTITLKSATAKITGKIYVKQSAWSKKSVYSGAKVVGYNESENVANPTKYLPSISVNTEDNGSYIIPDVILNNTYYVYAFVPEKPVYFKKVYVSSNVMDNTDFIILPSTPTLKVTMKRTAQINLFRFIIQSPRPLVGPPECYYSPGTSLDPSRQVRALPTKGVKNSYNLDVEIPYNDDDEYYTLQIKGQYGIDKYMTETITFSKKALAKAKKNVEHELAEGGAILIDDERSDNTEVKLDPGSLTSEEMVDMPVGGFLSALPNFKMSKTSQEIAQMVESVMADIAASDVYDINLNQAQVNKSFDVTINYDRSKVEEDEMDDLRVYRYNSATDQWEPMDGVVSIDPLTATVSVETDALSSAVANAPKRARKAAVKNGVYTINRAVSTSQTGVFAVFKQDPSTARLYAGSEFTIINFPNPFDLKAKTVTMADVNSSASQQIKGTMLKYTLPSTTNGRIKFFIYNLAGELVKEIDEGIKTGGYYYYTEWDGTNDNGEDCASGIYFLIAKCDGKKLNGKLLKIAILK